MAIWIAPATPGMVLTSEIFIGISAVPIGVPSRGAVKNMVAASAAV